MFYQLLQCLSPWYATWEGRGGLVLHKITGQVCNVEGEGSSAQHHWARYDQALAGLCGCGVAVGVQEEVR